VEEMSGSEGWALSILCFSADPSVVMALFHPLPAYPCPTPLKVLHLQLKFILFLLKYLDNNHLVTTGSEGFCSSSSWDRIESQPWRCGPGGSMSLEASSLWRPP